MSAARLATPATIQRTYFVLLLGNTLAASLIWGINTIFLLDAGLSNLEAFAANAFFTAGMVLFEVPTGVVADTAGRRVSYLLGTVTLAASTLLYVLLWRIRAPFWQWAVVSILIGLGVHVLLRCGRGVAGRRAQGDGLHWRAGSGVRSRPGGHRSGDAWRLGGWRVDRATDQSGSALRPPRRDPRRHVRGGLQADARCGVLS